MRNKFQERLKEIIKQTGKTQTEIAKDLKTTPQNITNWKQGYNYPDFDMLIEMADYFGVCTDYLLGRQDWY